MLSQIVKVFKAINSNRNPSEIANAFCLGVMLGFMPKNNALWFIVFIFFLFVRMNKPMYLIVTAIFSQFAWHLDFLFDSIGYKILTIESLKNFYGTLLEIPFVGFTNFNNTIVAGSLCFSLLIYIPLFILIRLLVLLWRKKFAFKLGQSAFMKAFSKTPIIKKIADLVEERL